RSLVDDLRPSMSTGVDQAVELAIAITRNHQRLAEHLQSEVVARLFGPVPPTDGEPVPLQDVLDFPVVNLLVVVASRGNKTVQARLTLTENGFQLVLSKRRTRKLCVAEGFVHCLTFCVAPALERRDKRSSPIPQTVSCIHDCGQAGPAS